MKSDQKLTQIVKYLNRASEDVDSALDEIDKIQEDLKRKEKKLHAKQF